MPYADPAERAAYNQAYREKNRELLIAKASENAKRRRKTHPHVFQHNALMRRYGISLEQFNAIIDAQNKKCALCEEALKLGTKSVHVDHCHQTGKVRGVLCARCNLGIGRFGDTVEGLEKAIAYLRRGL